MTAKNKAIELVEKFSPFVDCDVKFKDSELKNAKQCALILANEILGYMGADRGTEFWQEVKIEIEKL